MLKMLKLIKRCFQTMAIGDNGLFIGRMMLEKSLKGERYDSK